MTKRYAWGGSCETCQIEVDIKAHTPDALRDAAQSFMRRHEHAEAPTVAAIEADVSR